MVYAQIEMDNGVDNKISHKRDVISMGHSRNMDSASSQFFICDADVTFLDGQYVEFGHVTDGLSVVDEMVDTPVTVGILGERSVPRVYSTFTSVLNYGGQHHD